MEILDNYLVVFFYQLTIALKWILIISAIGFWVMKIVDFFIGEK